MVDKNEQKDGFATILILDDDQDVIDILEDQLTGAGFHCLSARSGSKAAAILNDQPVDIVLCDVFLENENGMEFLKHVKRTNQSIRVIMMTADPSIEIVIQGQRFGGDDFIIKPVFFPLLLLRLKHHLEIKNLNSRFSAMMLENERLKAIARFGITYNDQLNSPLTALMGYIEFLKDFCPENEDEYRNIIVDIERTVEIMRQRLENLSHLSRLQEKRYPHSSIGMYEPKKVEDKV